MDRNTAILAATSGDPVEPDSHELRQTILNEICQIQLAANDLVADAKAIGPPAMGKLRLSLIALEPKTMVRFGSRPRALNRAQEVVTSRWRIYEGLSGNIIWSVVAALVFWLMGIFFSIGAITPRHALAFGRLFINSLSVAVASTT